MSRKSADSGNYAGAGRGLALLMGWLAKLLRLGRSLAVAARAAPPVLAGLPVHEQLIGLLAIPDELQASVLASVTQAFADAASFYDEHRRYRLAERYGLTYPENAALTPKFVLIDTLQAFCLMAEVDWKSDEDEIRQEVRVIMQAKGLTPIINAAEQYGDEPTHEVLYLLHHEELSPAGYSLQTLDIQSDSYVFTIVRREDAAQVQKLFQQL